MPTFDPAAYRRDLSRRTFLTRSAYGLGGLALAHLLGGSARAGERWRGVVNPPHFPPKVKRGIHLCMAGGPSQFETFDPKPRLKELHGKPFPESFTRGQQLAQLQNTQLIARGPFCDFKKCGQSGLEVAELFPHLGSIADEIPVTRPIPTQP